MKKEISNKELERKARKIIDQKDVVKYLQLHYNVTFSEAERKNDMFEILYSLTSKDINKLLRMDNTDMKLKQLYDIIYYRERKNRKTKKSYYRAKDSIVSL